MKTLCVASLFDFVKNGSLIAPKFKNKRNTNKAVMSFIIYFEIVNKMACYMVITCSRKLQTVKLILHIKAGC